MRHSRVGQCVLAQILVTLASLLPFIANAAPYSHQENFRMGGLCLSQNWDTPEIQDWLRTMPKQQRMRIYSGANFSASTKRCLMKKKSAKLALCNHAVAETYTFRQEDPMRITKRREELKDADKKMIWDAFAAGGCQLLAPSRAVPDWLPDDLKPSASTLQLLKRAEKGDATAQFEAYKLYADGADVPANSQQADYWLRRAARQGYNDAMQLLTEIDKEQAKDKARTRPSEHWDVNQALLWYVSAADLGGSPEADELEQMHASRNHVKKNVQALSADAMLKLSERYQEGTGKPKDAKVAQQWRRRADALGVNGEATHLSKYFPWGDAPDDESTMAKIQLEHAKAGDVDAQIAIATRYEGGDGVAEDLKAAIVWWKQAAKAGDPIAQRMLGKRLMLDLDASAGSAGKAGREWLQKAQAQGDMEAQATLATWHATEHLREDDAARRSHLLEAIRLIREAVARGYCRDTASARIEYWTAALEPL